MNEKGLDIQKTGFDWMLRNPITGIHEAIISEELFQKAQGVLARIVKKNATRAEKVVCKDELSSTSIKIHFYLPKAAIFA